MRGLVGVICVAALTAAAPAAAGNPEALHLAKTLKTSMVARYKKVAPRLTFTTVTCRLPSSGSVAHCTAKFTYSSRRVKARGYYPVTVKLLQTGQIRWTAASPRCRDARTGKTLRC